MSILSMISPDAALVRRALADEPDAFETLVLRYQRQVHAIARATGVRADCRDDVVQETLLQAYRGLPRLRSPEAFGPWLVRIARNVSLKHQLRDRRVPGEGVASDELESIEASPLDQADVQELRERLWRAVDRLPEGVREAIFLYYYGGESTRRVALLLEISSSAVKMRLKRGREMLRGSLWSAFRETVSGETRSRGEWRRRARRDAFLITSIGRGDGGAIGGAAAAGLPSAGTGLSHAIAAGATIMTIKKTLAVSLGAVILFVSALAWMNRRESVDEAAPAVGTTSRATEISQARAPDGELPVEKTAALDAPAMQPITGISGTVVFEGTHQPAPGARVSATVSGASRHTLEVSTGEDGGYLFAGLPPGEYRLWSWKEDWYAGSPEAVEVRSGEITPHVDWTLRSGVVVEGEVLVEGSERPIPDAVVGFGGFRFTTTDERGRFRLEGIPPGARTITARAPGFVVDHAEIDAVHGEAPFVRFELAEAGVIEGLVFDPDGEPTRGARLEASTYWRNAAESNESGRYQIDGISLHTRSLRISAVHPSGFTGSAIFPGFESDRRRERVDIHLSRARTFAGRVLDSDRASVEGATIRVQGRRTSDTSYTSDADGRFVIDGASGEISRIEARKRGFSATILDLSSLSDDVDELELVLERGHFVAGVIVDVDGDPVEGAWVYVDESGDRIGPARSARSDVEGRFRIEDLGLELDEIGAIKEGYVDSRSNPVQPDQDDVRLVLVESGQIHGLVVDRETGAPVHPVVVKVTWPESPHREKNRERGFRGTLAASLGERGLPFGNDDGSFRIRSDLAPGIYYKLIVQAQGYREAVLPGVEAWAASEDRPAIRAELDRGGVLHGRVIVSNSEEAAGGVRVSHLADSEQSGRGYWSEERRGERRTVRVAVTDADGRFVLDGLGDDAGVLLLEKPGFARTAVFEVVPGPDVRVFEIDVGAAVTGIVSRMNGEPIARADVTVEINRQGFPGGRTDAEGRYRIDGLPSGAGRLDVRRDGAMRISAPFEAIAGELTVVDLTEPTGAITGRVTRGGEAVADSPIFVRETSASGTSGRWKWLRTDREGRFHLEGLDRGMYLVTAVLDEKRHPEYGVERSVEVSGDVVDCDISLDPLRTIRGQVVDHVTGEAIRACSVALYRLDSSAADAGPFRSSPWLPEGRAEIGDDARFELEVLRSGSYLIVAHPGATKDVCGWVGPIAVEAAGASEFVTVPSGGPGRLELSLRDERGAAVEGAQVYLQRAGDHPAYRVATSGPSGRAVLENIPLGKYRLRIFASDFHDVDEAIEISAAPAERSIRMQDPSWIVFDLDAPLDRVEGHAVVCRALAGDPGWSLRSVPDGLPATSLYFQGKPLRVKTLPGRYRLRFEIKEQYTASPTVSVHEVEVVVPENGATPVSARL